MATNKTSTSTTLSESIVIAETDLTTLSLSQSADHYSSSDYEAFASIEAELECMNAEEVTTTEDDSIALEETVESEIITSDIEMTEITEEIVPHEQIVYTTANQSNQNIVFQTKPTLQRVPITAVQAKPSTPQPTQSQSIMIVSPASGQGTSQILKISHPASASPGQLQSIAQSLITGKGSDGTSIVTLRPAQSGKSSNITVGNSPGLKTIQTPVKRPAQQNQQPRNVFTKMIISGNQQQEVLLASPPDTQQQPTIKFITSNTTNQSSTKTITYAQAQQMGLLTTKPQQHILPSNSQKQGIIVNKLIQSSSSQPPKLAIIPTSTVKSPAKILPAPTAAPVRPTFSSTVKTAQQNTQKVIIRQNSLKPGTVLGGGQFIRIPSNQNISTNQVHQIQMPGRQVQYLRLVSTGSSPTTNVMTVGKAKMPSTMQSMGVAQKVGGQQQIVKVVPLNTGNQQLRTVVPKQTMTVNNSQRVLIPATPNTAKNAVAIPASALSQLASGQAVISTNSNVGNIVVLPAQYLQQQQQQQQNSEETKTKSSANVPTVLSSHNPTTPSSANLSGLSNTESPKISKSSANADANGIRPRKPCNCTKSQCLKLYCDCFANGEFCHMCNCNNCSNNLDNEEERQRAIKSCLERNPNAFRPKIGKGRETGDDIRRHNKGCNCKRSGCLKNYCECYEAKIPCSNNCKCIGCRNVEEPALEKKSLKDLAEAAEVRTNQLTLNKAKIQQLSEMAFRIPAASNTGPRQPFNFLTDKVVEITCQCLMAQAEEADRGMLDEETSQRLIIEEFGRCLKEIIGSAHKAEATTTSST